MNSTATLTTAWFSAAIAAIVVASAATAAQEYTVHMNGANGTTTIYVSPNAVRRTEPGFKVDVIYRLSEGKIIYIDHQKKTYSEVTLAEARQRSTQATAGMSPQTKAMMSRMGNATPSFTKVGAGETIAGYATEKYLIKSAAAETEILAAPALSVPVGYYEATRVSAGATTPLGGANQSSEAMKNINGMILKRVGTMTMNRMTVTEVATSVDKAPIPSSTFEPPAGYKSVPLE